MCSISRARKGRKEPLPDAPSKINQQTQQKGASSVPMISFIAYFKSREGASSTVRYSRMNVESLLDKVHLFKNLFCKNSKPLMKVMGKSHMETTSQFNIFSYCTERTVVRSTDLCVCFTTGLFSHVLFSPWFQFVRMCQIHPFILKSYQI